MSNPLYLLAMFGIFHLVGGVFAGRTLRAWMRGRFTIATIPMFVWGLAFGGLPLVGGMSVFLLGGAWHFFAIELGIFFGAILIPAFTPDWFIESFDWLASDVINRTLLVLGAGFVLVGMFLGGTMASSSTLFGLLFGGIFAGIGLALLIAWLVRLVRSKQG